ncbi:LAETG motif-containing sortase-dependent surface protein [Streptomyces sp. NPDC006270]|uniref:LAETG motif-containing sortase-dependent surface protein n=1 Tax=Streptomyces sp. NPDC006270 TaxID=3364741 RepID=UPI00369EC412
MLHSFTRRVPVSIALALGAAVAATGTAAATDGGDGWRDKDASGYTQPRSLPGGVDPAETECAFLSDGKPWTARQGLAAITPAADGTISLQVRGDGGGCTVSLASYLAHGPTFATSGQQVLVGFDTVSVADGASDTLAIPVPDAGCFAQIDLYKGSTRYDGQEGEGHGPAPVGPDGAVIGDKLIAAWNGPEGGKDCVTEPSPEPSSPSPSQSTSTPPPPRATPSATPSETRSATPSGSPSASDGPAPTPTASESQPAATGGSGDLAETGGGDSTAAVAGGAAVLLLAGGGVLFAMRRRGARRDA